MKAERWFEAREHLHEHPRWRELSALQVRVLELLLDHANNLSLHAFPSNERLAKQAGRRVRVSSVTRALSVIADKGLIALVRRGGGRSLTNVWRVAPGLDGTPPGADGVSADGAHRPPLGNPSRTEGVSDRTTATDATGNPPSAAPKPPPPGAETPSAPLQYPLGAEGGTAAGTPERTPSGTAARPEEEMHGGLSSSSPEELRREAEALLRSMGDITADTRARILGSSAPPDRLLALVRSAAALSRRRVPRRGGWIVNALKDEGYLAGRTMTPAAAADLVQRIRRDEVRPSALKGRAFDDRGLLRSKEWAEVVQRARAEGWGADTLERLIEFRPDDDLAVSTLVRGKDEAAILAALDAATGGNGGARGGGA